MEDLKCIIDKFASCGWELLSIPAQQWLDEKISKEELISAIKEADSQCGNCGCEFDPLYKKALNLL